MKTILYILCLLICANVAKSQPPAPPPGFNITTHQFTYVTGGCTYTVQAYNYTPIPPVTSPYDCDWWVDAVCHDCESDGGGCNALRQTVVQMILYNPQGDVRPTWPDDMKTRVRFPRCITQTSSNPSCYAGCGSSAFCQYVFTHTVVLGDPGFPWIIDQTNQCLPLAACSQDCPANCLPCVCSQL